MVALVFNGSGAVVVLCFLLPLLAGCMGPEAEPGVFYYVPGSNEPSLVPPPDLGVPAGQNVTVRPHVPDPPNPLVSGHDCAGSVEPQLRWEGDLNGTWFLRVFLWCGQEYDGTLRVDSPDGSVRPAPNSSWTVHLPEHGTEDDEFLFSMLPLDGRGVLTVHWLRDGRFWGWESERMVLERDESGRPLVLYYEPEDLVPWREGQEGGLGPWMDASLGGSPRVTGNVHDEVGAWHFLSDGPNRNLTILRHSSNLVYAGIEHSTLGSVTVAVHRFDTVAGGEAWFESFRDSEHTCSRFTWSPEGAAVYHRWDVVDCLLPS